MVKRSVILGIAIVLLTSSVVMAQIIKFEPPASPEQYINETIKMRIGPEIKTFVGALAGILVVRSLIMR